MRRIIPAGTTATTDSITIPRAQNAGSITLNPDGVTLKSSPDAPSMTVCHLAVETSFFCRTKWLINFTREYCRVPRTLPQHWHCHSSEDYGIQPDELGVLRCQLMARGVNESIVVVQIGNAGVRYNEPEQNPIPAQAEGSLFPGQGVRRPLLLQNIRSCISNCFVNVVLLLVGRLITPSTA